MKTVYILIVYFTFGMGFSHYSYSQSENLEVINAVEEKVTNSPEPKAIDVPMETSILGDFEIQLSIIVLIFGSIVLFLEVFLIYKQKITGSQAYIIIIISLVVISSLFLISAGFNSNQITPIIGLLGTVVGYLLSGSAINKDEINNPKP